jgi:hypothetical protein
MKNVGPALFGIARGSNFTMEYLGEFEKIRKYFRVIIWGLEVID